MEEKRRRREEKEGERFSLSNISSAILKHSTYFHWTLRALLCLHSERNSLSLNALRRPAHTSPHPPSSQACYNPSFLTHVQHALNLF